MTPEQRIAQLAARRGAAAPVVPPRPTSPPRAKRDPILNRPLPMAWRGRDDSWNGPQSARRLAAIEQKLACGLIARAMGEGWRRVERDHFLYLEHRSGFRLQFKSDWNKPDRYRISPVGLARPGSITVSAGRSPASIARDIQNRILDHGAVDAFELQQLRAKSDRLSCINKRLSMLRLAVILGMRQLSREDRWRFCSYPETNSAHFEGFAVDAALEYNGRVSISVDCESVDVAAAVCRMFRLVTFQAIDMERQEVDILPDIESERGGDASQW